LKDQSSGQSIYDHKNLVLLTTTIDKKTKQKMNSHDQGLCLPGYKMNMTDTVVSLTLIFGRSTPRIEKGRMKPKACLQRWNFLWIAKEKTLVIFLVN